MKLDNGLSAITILKKFIKKTLKNCQSKNQTQRQLFDRAIRKWVRGNDGETKKIRRKNSVKKKKVIGVH